MTKGSVVRDLYSTLEKIGYPEIAQTRYEEFENNIILNGDKRFELLTWILKKCPHFNPVSFSKLKDVDPNSKIFNCYNQIGLCNNEKILMGNCPIDEQTQFLHLLTTFLRSLHLNESALVVNEKSEDTKTISKEEGDRIEFNNNKDIPIPNIKIESSVCSIQQPTQKKEPTSDQNDKKYDLDHLCAVANINSKESKDQDISSYEPTLQKFHEYFKNTTSLSLEIGPGTSNSEQELSSNIQNVHSAFSIVNKTFINEVKIKSLKVPESAPSNTSRSLTQVIKNNLVTLEQACNILSNSQD
ncbi:hypothetical protein QAD02_016822 [Eretmocerus hayati]|uniref:Uncharacterized protein n=1 Tax=Eretmocerus hayati TaxID=131215 RepID=A0ACC2PC98_9HYME|nr:hypothetical protein QAD02_016822 [Eretmocerus hayati]